MISLITWLLFCTAIGFVLLKEGRTAAILSTLMYILLVLLQINQTLKVLE